MRASSLILVMALGAAAGCGDPVRLPGYEGAPLFVLRARVPAALAQQEVSLELTVENGRPPETLRRFPAVVPDRLGQVQLPLGRPLVVWPPPSAVSRPTDVGTTVSVCRISTAQRGGLTASSVHDFLVHSELGGRDMELLESGGPVVSLDPGYQLIRRRCLPDGSVTLERLPPDTVVDLELEAPSSPLDPVRHQEPAALARCGITGVKSDDGRVQVPGGRRVEIEQYPFSIQALAWSPSGQLFVMIGPYAQSLATEIRVLDAADLMPRPTRVTSGRFERWLAVHGDGAFLFTRSGAGNQLLRYQLPPPAPGAEPTSTSIDLIGPAVISPDGRRLAMATRTSPEIGDGVIRSLDTGETQQLPHRPLAWSPDSTSLLVAGGLSGGPGRERLHGPFGIVGRDGTVRAVPPLPFADQVLGFWNDRGPHLVSMDFPAGVRGVALQSGEQVTILHPEHGRSDTGEVFATTGAVFIWSMLCPGFGHQVCDTRLIRVGLADGTREVLAIAAAPSPMAASPDGRRLAIAEGGAVILLDR